MPVAGSILLASGIHAQAFGVLLGGRTGWLLDVALTLLWVVGITAAFSILDHMDGLCAGAAALGAIFYAVLAGLNRQVLLTNLSAPRLGPGPGFPRSNFNPPKNFPGGGGRHLLCFLFCTLGF